MIPDMDILKLNSHIDGGKGDLVDRSLDCFQVFHILAKSQVLDPNFNRGFVKVTVRVSAGSAVIRGGTGSRGIVGVAASRKQRQAHEECENQRCDSFHF